MNPLRHTPLHPQWLVLRRERTAFAAAGAVLKGRVLDIGCADKPLRPHLNDEVQYLGLDYYATAKQLYDTQPDVYGDGQRLPFADASFDGVALLDVLEHLPDPETSIAEIERVLVPGGVLALQVPFVYPLHDAPFDFHRWTRYGLTRLLAFHGFELLVR